MYYIMLRYQLVHYLLEALKNFPEKTLLTRTRHDPIQRIHDNYDDLRDHMI